MLFGECRRRHATVNQTIYQAMIISKAIDEFHSSFEYPCQVKNLKPLSKTTDLQKMASLVNLETKNGLINIAMKTP